MQVMINLKKKKVRKQKTKTNIYSLRTKFDQKTFKQVINLNESHIFGEIINFTVQNSLGSYWNQYQQHGNWCSNECKAIT